ncbi:MAG TPA: hypothetical protein PKL77_09800 [Candidatus Omnitrophota bacterium]|nr:hypothetical protein [Candidatus Omnitrophota bacterium]
MTKRKVIKSKRGKIPQIKKDIKDFLSSEEGKISKKNIVKIGISTAIVGMMMDPQHAFAQHTDNVGAHTSDWQAANAGHNSHQPHTSTHASHSAHGAGGWC